MPNYLYGFADVADAMGDWMADNCDHMAGLLGSACDCEAKFWDMVADIEEDRAMAIAEERAEMMADSAYWDEF